MSFNSSFPQPQPPNSSNPIGQLPGDFDQPDKPRPGTMQTGKYDPWQLFKDYSPTPEESAAAKAASRAFMGYWLPGTALGLFASAALARSGKLRELGLAGNAIMIGTMFSGELLGRKMGEAAGTAVLMRDLPYNSQLRAAMEQFQRTGQMDPSILENRKSETRPEIRPEMEGDVRQRVESAVRRMEGREPPVRIARQAPQKTERRERPMLKEEQFGMSDPDADEQARSDLLYRKGSSSVDSIQSIGNEQASGERLQKSDREVERASKDGEFLRTKEDWETAEKSGKVRRNAYGDVIE
jgi:hypothetical protein